MNLGKKPEEALKLSLVQLTSSEPKTAKELSRVLNIDESMLRVAFFSYMLDGHLVMFFSTPDQLPKFKFSTNALENKKETEKLIAYHREKAEENSEDSYFHREVLGIYTDIYSDIGQL